MKGKISGVILVLICFIYYSDVNAQNTVNERTQLIRVLDSLSREGLIFSADRKIPEINLNKDQALKFLQNRYKTFNWKNPDDPLRLALRQLIFFVSNNPYDSTRNFLENYSYDSINIPWEKFFDWDTLKVKIPVIPKPLIVLPADSMIKADTTIKIAVTDSIKTGIKAIIPELLPKNNSLFALKDTIILVAVDTLNEVTSVAGSFPFRHYNWPYEGDSIKVAIKSLITFLENRDSLIVNLAGTSKDVTPVWLNSKSDRLVRFWLRNEFSDSVSVWLGSVSKNTLGLFLEEGIIFRRPTKQSNFSDAQLNLKTINSKRLQEVNKIYVKPQYWKLHSEASFILNQATLTNWVKGGESSISTAMDITGFANYNNKQIKTLSNNFIRLKYGLVASGNTGIRKNLDLLETNSKLNHTAFGKFDFSGTMLFKTQIAKGYNYPNDSVPVSKFLNPAILTIGLGLDYKLNKNTSINFAPFTYKGTYVTDTAHIDQTKYGIPHHRKSLHEPGVSLMVNNVYNPFKTITVTNRLQLFTNYIHNPMNIDVDWEMIVIAKLNWFTDVRFNTHLIFDDDTKTLVFDKDNKPVMQGTVQKKTARIQFKELLGFTFVFRF